MAASGVQLAMQGATIAPSILMTVLAVLYWRFYHRLKRDDIRVTGVVLSTVFSILLVLGYQLDRVGDIAWSFLTLIRIVCLAFSLFPAWALLTRLLENRPVEITSGWEWSRKSSWVVFAVVLGIELLYLAITYPGVYAYDAPFLILSATDSSVGLTTHFSVPYSLLIGWLVSFSESLFGAPEHGLATLMLIQAIAISLMVVRIAHGVWLIAHNRKLVIFSVLFFVLNPLLMLQTISASPDVFFCACFGCIATELVILGCGKATNKPSSILLLAALCLAFMLLRNNGVYVLILVALVLLVMVMRSYGGKSGRIVTLAFIVPICLYYLISGPVYSFAGVHKGDSLQEMMSVPVQQLARVYHYPVKTADRRGTLTDSPYQNNAQQPSEQIREQIESFFSEPLPVYESKPMISDNQKSILLTDELEKRPLEFLRLYLTLGMQYPQEYAEAFLMNSLGFWYPDKTYLDSRMYHPLIEYSMMDVKSWNEDYTPMERMSLLPPLDFFLWLLIGKMGINRVPIISTLLNPGTYFFLFLLVCGYALRKCMRQQASAYLPFFVLMGALFLTYLLSPVCIYRYCMAFISCTPLLITVMLMLFCKKDSVLSHCARPFVASHGSKIDSKER